MPDSIFQPAGALQILIPNPQDVLRPLVHIGNFHSALHRFPNLLGVINGTFFDAPAHGRPQIWGDVLTPREFVWDFVVPQAHVIVRDGEEDYFRPASPPPKTGYDKRWGVAGQSDETAFVYQGQPSTLEQRLTDRWAMSGAALILHEGEITHFGGAPGELGLTTDDGGHFQDDVMNARPRSMVLLGPNGRPHLAVVVEDFTPKELAVLCRQAGYLHALMLDGGGSTAMSFRDEIGVPATTIIDTNRELQPLLGIFRPVG